jgi:hypothetical protein
MTWKKFLGALALCMSLSVAAEAQTYVRPSKGKAITVFSQQTGNATSAVYDMSSFSSVQFLITPKIGPGSCSPVAPSFYTAKLSIEMSNEPNGPFYAPLIHNQYLELIAGAGDIQLEEVSPLPGYIRIIAVDVPATCTYTIKMTPIPFSNINNPVGMVGEGYAVTKTLYPVIVGGRNYDFGSIPTIFPLDVDVNGALRTTNVKRGYGIYDVMPITIPASPAAPVQVAYAGFTVGDWNARLQNTGVQPIYCIVGESFFAGQASPTKYNIVLSGGTAANDGKGAAYTVEHMAENVMIKCVSAAAGASSMTVLFWGF